MADDACGRADGAERLRTVGRTGAEKVRTVERTGGRAEEARTRPSTRGRADGQTGRLGPEEPRSGGRADWGGRAYKQSAGRADGRTSARAHERVGLGLKATFHEAGFTLGRPVRLPRQSTSAQGAWECSGV